MPKANGSKNRGLEIRNQINIFEKICKQELQDTKYSKFTRRFNFNNLRLSRCSNTRSRNNLLRYTLHRQASIQKIRL